MDKKKQGEIYKFRVEETGEVIGVDYGQVLQQDIAGFIKLTEKTTGKPVMARRVHDDHRMKMGGTRGPEKSPFRAIVSDTLGFGAHQLAEKEADRKLHGHSGVEFVEDKTAPGFMQVKCDSPYSWSKYVKHRGMTDLNGINGGRNAITAEDIKKAKKRLSKG